MSRQVCVFRQTTQQAARVAGQLSLSYLNWRLPRAAARPGKGKRPSACVAAVIAVTVRAPRPQLWHMSLFDAGGTPQSFPAPCADAMLRVCGEQLGVNQTLSGFSQRFMRVWESKGKNVMGIPQNGNDGSGPEVKCLKLSLRLLPK